jgi:hypothetical protein
MHKSPPNWLVISVAQGIGLLMGARIQGAPFAGNKEDTQAVCEAWLIALMNRSIDWHEDTDKERLETGFQKLLTNCRKWPAPAELFDYLPNRPETATQKLSHRPDMRSESRVIGYRSLNQIRMSLSLPEITF